MYLYVNDPYEEKYQFLIKKRKNVGTKHFNDSKVFIGYSHDMQDVYEYMEEYNPEKKRKVLIVFDDILLISIIIKTQSSNN